MFMPANHFAAILYYPFLQLVCATHYRLISDCHWAYALLRSICCHCCCLASLNNGNIMQIVSVITAKTFCGKRHCHSSIGYLVLHLVSNLKWSTHTQVKQIKHALRLLCKVGNPSIEVIWPCKETLYKEDKMRLSVFRWSCTHRDHHLRPYRVTQLAAPNPHWLIDTCALMIDAAH